ncbi:MAG: FKBP-type peptidyl-prolyl cis-trans isomerase [Rickettsiales bacterium]|nr:FKBP-type peptidyl-prolyl cis-trans isomerase [Rickettsiales bacterium]
MFALYRGTLQDGTEFDSNQDRDSPFKFNLGEGRVIKGWDEGFATMKIGEKATLICSPDYAYGKRGSPPRIPPNSTLNF